MKSGIKHSEFGRSKFDDPYGLRSSNYYGSDRAASPIPIPTSKNQFYLTPPSSPSLSSSDSISSQSDLGPEHMLSFSHDGADDPLLDDLVREMEMRSSSTFKNTYFFDGSSSFISLPSLGNSSTKAASQISRVFEEWLESKISHNSSLDAVPVLEESVSRNASDIMRKLRARSHRLLSGLSRVLIKIRVGHICSYPGSWMACEGDSDDMDEFFHQFPLFAEVLIVVKPNEGSPTNCTEVLLAVENTGINPNKPFTLREFVYNDEGRRSPV